ncbi:MAG: bifunctional oligoribonuclease/PAP phosphatase NrnA [Treponema sp.]|jgi:bifunctional oligoribonuclease and PAP phosphatase NrnA|nr:bifunctional oligoribonuclease/PAP phosphatase NrnA [Treponema sp.]
MNKFDTEKIQEFKTFINKHSFFLVIGHKEPDGDCIASCLGTAAILKAMNKKYQLLSAGPFKRNEITNFKDLFSSEPVFLDNEERKYTGLIVVDCSEFNRLGEIDGDIKNLDTFIIDHHKTSEMSPSSPNAQGYIDPSAPACAYLIQLFYESLIGKIPADIAKILFFGLSTDTGFFRFLKEDAADVFSAAARLVESGACPRDIYDDINNGKPYLSRKLLGVLLSKTELYLNNRLAITYETLEDTRKYGIEGRDSDALYQLLLSSKGIEAVVFLRQDTPTSCTGGFRSQNIIDVSVVASKFGGGGHKNASGMCTDGQIETLIPSIVKEFARIM